MENNNLKVGDVVCLNSSPQIQLTITSIEDNEVCVAYFIVERQKFEYARFPIEAVKLYTPNVAPHRVGVKVR